MKNESVDYYSLSSNQEKWKPLVVRLKKKIE
jgi:hypothetical protein